MNIYFDLDGTLIDVSTRFYMIYYDLLDMFNCHKRFNKERYWKMKRERISEDEIVRRTCIDMDVKRYNKARKMIIESPKYLDYDIPFSFTFNILKKLAVNNRLVVVSLRESLNITEMEMDRFELKNFFDKILVRNVDMDESWKIKVELIKSDHDFEKENSIIVGDTEAEFLAAKELDIPCLLVSCGIRTKEYLAHLNSQAIIEDISELLDDKIPLYLNEGGKGKVK